MKTLLELANVILSNGVTADQILDSIENEKGVYSTFLKGTLSGRWANDKDVALEIYGSPVIDERYRQLKFRAKHHLLQFLPQLRPSDDQIDNYRNAHYRCVYLAAHGQILLSYMAVNAAVDIFQQALTIANDYGFTAEAFAISRVLEGNYSFSGRVDKVNQQQQQTDHLLELVKAEIQSNRITRIANEIANSTDSISQELLDRSARLTSEMTEIAQHHSSNHITKQLLYMRLYDAIFRSDYQGAVDIARTAQKHYDEHPNLQTRTVRISLHLELAACLTERRSFEEAEVELEKALRYAPTNTVTWATVVGFKVQVAFRRGKYVEVANGITELLEFIQQGQAGQFWKERIVLYHGYLSYVVKSGVTEVPALVRDLANSFDIDAFLSDSPVATRDKTGANVARIILPLLLLLSEGNIEAVASKSEAMLRYRKAHLKDSRFKRSAAFLKLIQLLIEHDFDCDEAEIKGARYLRDIQPSSENEGDVTIGLEVILYDQLWQMLTRHVRMLLRSGTIAPFPEATK